MGLDLYIEACIKEKKTGRAISADNSGLKEGFFTICRWCGWEFGDILDQMTEISNQYGKTEYTNIDYIIPIPQPALQDIYALLIKHSCLLEEEKMKIGYETREWEERHTYEQMNLVNAVELHNLLFRLKSIEYHNDIHIDKRFILQDEDWRKLQENPQAYEWDFRVFNSY